MQDCNDAARLVKGRGRKEMQWLSSRESCLPSVGLRLHKSGRTLVPAVWHRSPGKLRTFSRGVEAAELCFF